MRRSASVAAPVDSATLIVLAVTLATMLAWYLLTRPKRRRRAGCVPLRVEPSGRCSLLLIQSRKHPEWWTFPAGGVEKSDKNVEQAAQRETREEAGIVGRIGRRICDVYDSCVRLRQT